MGLTHLLKEEKMRILIIKTLLILFFSCISFTTVFAVSQENSDQLATITATFIPTGQANLFDQLSNCRYGLVPCNITLKFDPVTVQGVIFIQNTSANRAVNVQARLPPSLSNVTQPSICETLEAMLLVQLS
jgi:hypothetical protein